MTMASGMQEGSHMATNVDAEIGKRIAERRDALGLKKMDVAALIDLSNSQYGRWEKGTKHLTHRDLARVATVLGVTVEHLTNGVHPQPGTLQQQLTDAMVEIAELETENQRLRTALRSLAAEAAKALD